ncbi:unnamed protein product [Symbiodinium sp. KB8]|nr:unnamed protein product [Symbiodinium sp. KB8]
MTCSDASSELSKFLKEYGVHEVLSNALALKGLETVDDFAYAFPEAAQELVNDFKVNYPGESERCAAVLDKERTPVLELDTSLQPVPYDDIMQCPTQGNIVLASSRLPTWPCPDEQLMVLEAAFIHLCHPGITTISFTSLLQEQSQALEVLSEYVVCHFGAKFSAYWWHRGSHYPPTPRLLSGPPTQSLAICQYVDDLLAALIRESAHESLLIMILMLTCLGALISWKKASIGDSLVWCGWRFNFAYETVELCAAKRDKLRLQIQDLLSRSKVPRKDLEACIGLLMWATNISQVLKPYLAPLYRLLTSPPGANFSIAPRMWPAFLHCLVIEWGNKPLHCKTDLPLMSKPTGHTWIRVSDPSCPVIKMTKAAQAYTVDEIRSFWPFLTKDAQKYIACFETLAQLALAMRAKAHHGHSCMNICLPAESDNTPTKGGVNKLFTTSWPLSEFLDLIASWSSANGIMLQVSHVAGAHNEWADDLSRGGCRPSHTAPRTDAEYL